MHRAPPHDEPFTDRRHKPPCSATNTEKSALQTPHMTTASPQVLLSTADTLPDMPVPRRARSIDQHGCLDPRCRAAALGPLGQRAAAPPAPRVSWLSSRPPNSQPHHRRRRDDRLPGGRNGHVGTRGARQCAAAICGKTALWPAFEVVRRQSKCDDAPAPPTRASASSLALLHEAAAERDALVVDVPHCFRCSEVVHGGCAAGRSADLVRRSLDGSAWLSGRKERLVASLPHAGLGPPVGVRLLLY